MEVRSTSKRTTVTPAFNYLREIETKNEGFVDQNSASWNLFWGWLEAVDALRRVA